MAKTDFVHLHVHTEYSLLDGLSNIKALTRHVKELGMDTIALTDHGVMYGAIEFYKKMKDENLKPIIGMEGYITDGDLKERGEKARKRSNHILLLVKNLTGYKNLMRLTSIAHTEGYYYRPRVDHDTLKKYSEGLICTSACMAGEVARALTDDNYEKAKAAVQWHLDVFGDDYYLEIQKHHYKQHAETATEAVIKNDLLHQAEAEVKTNEGVIKLSRELGVPIIATNDSHYIKKEDAQAQDALVCVSTGKDVADTKRLRFIDAPSYYITSPEEMADLFSDYPESLENTKKIADKCDLEIELYKLYFPAIDLPDNVTAEEELRERTTKGLKAKFEKVTPELTKRAEYELDIICTKEYAAYFLIYQDMAIWAKKRRIPINTRGSAAGSLVSYALGITTVDPIRYGLPFERFLNPLRPSPPDIDMDIADNKREEMLRYLQKKYGKDKVAQICTFGRMLARGSVRDVARVLGYPYEIGDKISKLIPMGAQGFPMTINRALDETPDLRNLYNSDTDAKKIIDLSKQVEGSARHISVHAAGVVISPTELNDFVPIQKEPSGDKIITQYEMHACEDVGLVKLDILGIRNLSILGEAVSRVKDEKDIDIDLDEIPIDDKKTFEMLSRGETMGTFQMSGSGMTRYIIELAPERVEDIMAMVALFRPGPIANIPDYIARKKGEQKIAYYHPKMKSFLEKSFGILVYQDDLIFTALELAGYNWETVDKFRKAVGKKIPEEMAKQHVIFVDGCIKHSGMTKKEAEGLWNLFEPFQGYGFNKAHAASYGMLAYQTAYMKANYPVEFMAALLTAESNDAEKIAAAVYECIRMGIRVLPPNINESDVDFKIIDDEESEGGKGILFGLSAIKNVGVAAIETILESRANGEFVSLADFCSRIDARKVNKRVVESLAKVGALSVFGNRAGVMSVLEEVRSKVKPRSTNGQQDLFFEKPKDGKDTKIKDHVVHKITVDIPEFEESELEVFERELLGFSLSAKPVGELLERLKTKSTHTLDEITQSETKLSEVSVACIVNEIRVVTTKKSGAEMAFASVKDETGTLDIVIFPQIYGETKSLWVTGTPLLIKGKVDNREDTPAILVNEVETEETIGNADEIKISIPRNTDVKVLKLLKSVLKKSPGKQKASLVIEGSSQAILLPFTINWEPELAKEIDELLK